MIDKAYDKNHSGCFPDNKLNKPEPLLLARDMTLRDHFAGLSMQGISSSDLHQQINFKQISKWAYQQADAMLEARNGNP